MSYIHPRCPCCGAEGEGLFKIQYENIISVVQTLKGFDSVNNPVYGNITVNGDKLKYIRCPNCGFSGKVFQFNRKVL